MRAAFFKWIGQRQEMLILAVFSVAFIIGLALFAVTGSLEIAAATIALSALAAPGLVQLLNPASKGSAAEDPVDARLRFLEKARQGSDLRIMALESRPHSPSAEEWERMQNHVNGLKTRLADLETRLALPAPLTPSMPKASPELPPMAFDETRIRAELLKGNVDSSVIDISSRLSGRLAYRHIVLRCKGPVPGDGSGSALRKAHLSDDLLRLFDRITLALTYDRANEIKFAGDPAVILCAVSPALASQRGGFSELIAMLGKTTALHRRFGIVFDFASSQKSLKEFLALTQGLQKAGCLVGFELDPFLLANPGEFVRLNPDFVMVAGPVLEEALSTPERLAIHPADLVSLFDRGGIDLIATGLRGPQDYKRAEKFGIHLFADAAKPLSAINQETPVRPASGSQEEIVGVFGARPQGQKPPAEDQSSSLRETLKRRSA